MSHVEVGSVVYRYNRLTCVDRTQERKQAFLEFDALTLNGVSNDVPWGAERLPACGSYTVSVHAAPVFDALPTSSDVHDRSSITYVVLVLHRPVCNDVKTVSDGGSNTVFEVDGRFFNKLWNTESSLRT